MPPQKILAGRTAFVAAAIGAAGAILSLVLASMMLQRHGDPSFLLIWLAAAAAIAAYARLNRRWNAAFERIYAQTARTPLFSTARGKWNGEATDVAFKELPAEYPAMNELPA